MQLSVLVDGVDGMVAATLPFGGSASAVAAVAAPEGEEGEQEQQQAVHSFKLAFNSAEYHDVTGDATYMNGEHTISAVLMVAGAGSDERVESGIHDVEFGNDDGYIVTADLGDNSEIGDDGRRWYGGPRQRDDRRYCSARELQRWIGHVPLARTSAAKTPRIRMGQMATRSSLNARARATRTLMRAWSVICSPSRHLAKLA